MPPPRARSLSDIAHVGQAPRELSAFVAASAYEGRSLSAEDSAKACEMAQRHKTSGQVILQQSVTEGHKEPKKNQLGQKNRVDSIPPTTASQRRQNWGELHQENGDE